MSTEGKDKGTIRDLFSTEAFAYNKEAFNLLQKIADAATESSKNMLQPLDLFDDDGKGSTEMPKLQQRIAKEQAPVRETEKSKVPTRAEESPAEAIAPAAAVAKNEGTDAASAMQKLIKSLAPQEPEVAAVESRAASIQPHDVLESHHGENHVEREAEAAAVQQPEFDLLG